MYAPIEDLSVQEFVDKKERMSKKNVMAYQFYKIPITYLNVLAKLVEFKGDFTPVIHVRKQDMGKMRSLKFRLEQIGRTFRYKCDLKWNQEWRIDDGK